MSTQLLNRPSELVSQNLNQAVVAVYHNHISAEAAVRRLAASNVPIHQISIIGRNFETQEDIAGFYQPADAALDGMGQGAWFGGLFGLMIGAFGFFVFPLVGSFMVLGPLAGLIAGAIGGSAIGGLLSGLIAAGVPRDQALKYQDRLKSGEFLVVVHGDQANITLAHKILSDSEQLDVQLHGVAVNS